MINGVLPRGEAALDPLAAAVARREQAALAAMPALLAALPRDEVALKAFDLVGLAALRRLLVDCTDSPAGTDKAWTPVVAPRRACRRWSTPSPPTAMAW